MSGVLTQPSRVRKTRSAFRVVGCDCPLTIVVASVRTAIRHMGISVHSPLAIPRESAGRHGVWRVHAEPARFGVLRASGGVVEALDSYNERLAVREGVTVLAGGTHRHGRVCRNCAAEASVEIVWVRESSRAE